MRNLTPGPKFSLLAATVILITLAVWPIGYAKAEKISFVDNQKEKRSLEDDVSMKAKRSLKYKDVNFAEHATDHDADKPLHYRKWESGKELPDDLQYQSDPLGSDGDSTYESDGYGYDDDEYDHVNYKRFDNDRDKLSEDVKVSKDASSYDKSDLMNDKKAAAPVPEATTIELLSFQAKNLSPGSQSMQAGKEDPKMNPMSMKNQPPFGSTGGKESLVDEKLKKKTSADQKANDVKESGNTGNDKNTGNVKLSDSKVTETKENVGNKPEKSKAAEKVDTQIGGIQNLKETAPVAENKIEAKNEDLSKNDAKIADKDTKSSDVKFQPEEKDAAKIKNEKDMEPEVSESKAGAKDETRDKLVSDYKDGFDNVGIADDEKSSDVQDNLAGLRDSRNELPYIKDPLKYVGKKDAARRQIGMRPSGMSWDMAKEDKNSYERGPKEPFHLDFPLADLQNTDYHRNFIKSLKRFKGLDESSRILSQGDTPSPYADEAKKQLASRVIEEEQRKRRSRLRRLKASPMFGGIRKRERADENVLYAYGPSIRARMQYGGYDDANARYNSLGYRRNMQGYKDPMGMGDVMNQMETKNGKNKREDDTGWYDDDDYDSYAEGQYEARIAPYPVKRKTQKSSWTASDYNQKKKLKDFGLYEEPSQYNTPLVLLQRNDNGQQSVKTFEDGRYKNEEGIDSEDLARLLSRDSNYVVLKKVPGKEQVQKVYDQAMHTGETGRSRSAATDSKKDKYKVTIDVAKANEAKSQGAYKGSHVDHLKKKDDVKDLSDFFKGEMNKELDEKREMLVSIDNRLSQFKRGEPNKKIMYMPPPLSQAYRHMKDFEAPDRLNDADAEQLFALNEKKPDRGGASNANQGFAGPGRVLKSYKKEGKEVVLLNRPFNAIAFKAKTQEAVLQNVSPFNNNPLPNINFLPPNIAITPSRQPNPNSSPTSSLTPNSNAPQPLNSMPVNNMVAPSKTMSSNMMPLQNSMMQNANSYMQIKLPEANQKSADGSRKYYLYGAENDMGSSPKHEIKVIQSDFSLPQDNSASNTNNNNNNNNNYLQQNYKAASPMKSTQTGKVLPSDKSTLNQEGDPTAYSIMQQQNAYDYKATAQQQNMANGYQTDKHPLNENFKKVSKKESDYGMSGNLKRFMRDFQGLGQNAPSYKTEDLSGMSLQELTSHGDRHLQKLNNLLKEIISNKVEVSGNAKNVKRGMPQKEEQKNWQMSGTDPQVRSGKWTSVVYDGSVDFADNSSPGESLLKNGNSAMVSEEGHKRTKRHSPYDSSKDSTKALEVKIKSIPYNVEPQPLNPPNNNANNANNANGATQQQKTATRACLQLPQDKLMDLMTFLSSDRNDYKEEEDFKNNNCLCRRQAPVEEETPSSPFQRKLLSVSEDDPDADKNKADSIRKSFESYLDPLAQKIAELENKTQDRERRKREIELDESMPNDFQNFLVTSLGGFGSQKREIVKKDEPTWESRENSVVDGNRDSNEGSTVGKRDTSKTSKDDATNIRIRIVDGNGSNLKGSDNGGKAGVAKDGKSEGESPQIHEVYLIAEKRKKKKFASPRSDQTPQKQPISNHLPQVETVYNPSPGSNKAQIEKINSNDSQMKMKCAAKPQTVYNATASMMEDNIIRNNLRTGNINTFTYQRKEEPTPYPLQSPTYPPTSSEFEMLDSKNPSRPKTYNSRPIGMTDHFGTSSLTNTNTEIIYKDETPQQFSNLMLNAKPLNPKQGYRSFYANNKGRIYKNGPDSSNPDPYQRDYAEEDPEYSDEAHPFSESRLSHQIDADYDLHDAQERASFAQGAHHQEGEPQENLNPKMVEMWKNYAKTHLTPASHREAMNREFQEAYLRSSGGPMNMRYNGMTLSKLALKRNENFGISLVRNLNRHDYDRLVKDKTGEKIAKRLAGANKRNTEPVQIGRRFFYTFKTEVPDEEYYALYQDLSKMRNYNKESQFRQLSEQKTAETVKRDAENYKTDSDRDGKLATRDEEVYEARNEENANRVKRSADNTKFEDESKIMEKRLSSGHLTENNYRKYHRKNSNAKRETDDKAQTCPDKRIKRDALEDALKADMLKRIKEEKKARLMVKNLKMELTKSDIPLIGPNFLPQDETPPNDNPQPLEDDKKKSKVNEENPYKTDQQHQSTVKSGTPDVYKTFEIKRGRRQQHEKRIASDGARHSIVSRSGPDRYQDTVFLKGVRARKVKKYSDEGFEPLTPDMRFSEKSGESYVANRNTKSAASQGSFEARLTEKTGSAIVNRKAEDKGSKAKASESANPPKQKFTHGFSHEAPLLTPTNPLNSPQIFDALKQIPLNPKGESKALHKHPSDSSQLISTATDPDKKPGQALKSKIHEEKKSEPLVGAVLVLTKRGNDKRHIESDYSDAERNFLKHSEWVPRRKEETLRDETRYQEKHSEVKKRSAEWHGNDMAAEASDLSKADRSAEIVNDDAGCRSCGGESETKSCNTKKTNNFKQSPFPFSQIHDINQNRNGEDGIGNSGEDILESILGRVESNPHFRRVIGPGLKWRGRKCYFEGEDRHRGCCTSPNRNMFVRQVRKILAKFVRDIEKLAAQDMRRTPCCKLDARSNRFLHELLEVPYELEEEGLEKQCKIQLDPILRGRCMTNPVTNMEATTSGSVDAASVEAMENRRKLVLKLLGEYQNLSEADKKRVEVLGQYLMHELQVLNSALDLKEEKLKDEGGGAESQTSTTPSEEKYGETSTSSGTQGLESTTSSAIHSSESTPTTDKDIKRGSIKLPFIWSNPEDMKLVKPGYQTQSEAVSNTKFQLPNWEELTPLARTEVTKSDFMYGATESPETRQSYSSKYGVFPENNPPPAFKFEDPGSKYENYAHVLPRTGEQTFSDFRGAKKVGELQKLGYGDAAGLQLSLKSHGPWFSNLDLAKGKPMDMWKAKHSFDFHSDLPLSGRGPASVTDLPYNSNFLEDAVDLPQMTGRRDAIDSYGLEYQDYDDDDAAAYQMPNLQSSKRHDRTGSG